MREAARMRIAALLPVVVLTIVPSTGVGQQPTLNVVVLGHIGHGKTTLSAAITKLQAERGLATYVPFGELEARQERSRGIVIYAARMKYQERYQRNLGSKLEKP